MAGRFGVLVLSLSLAARAAAQAPVAVTFSASDGWVIHADEYGAGSRAVVLIHGGRFTKESWRAQIPMLVRERFRVLAIDLRGFGASADGPEALNPGFGSPLDAMAAVRYLRSTGAKTVSLIGASMGADAAAGASMAANSGEVDRLILLAGSAGEPPEQLTGRKLFVVAKNDANAAGLRLPRIQAQFDHALPPKRLVLLEGDAHAQFLFDTDQGPRLTREMLRFMTRPRPHWAARHPVVMGTMIGAGVGLGLLASSGCGSSDYTCPGLAAFAAGTGAMFGSIGGLVVGIALR